MRSSYRFSIPFLIAAAAALSVDARVARTVMTPTVIEWTSSDRGAVVLAVQHPNGDVVTETITGRNPSLSVEGLADGVYSWELRDGSEAESGTFTIANGTIVRPDLPENHARPGRPAANPFYTDDVSAQGGVCAGSDCTNAESYGFVTIKTRDNYARLKLEDTSTSAGFPTSDWQIGTNDTFSGGAEKFFIEDLTAATVPLLIEGSTPSNALYLDSTGRVGMRTSTPAKDLHIATASTPTIRLEQTGVNARSWDMFGNNFNFVVHDATVLTSPFIIRSGAPTGALTVDAAARIGLGVAFPSYQIHHSSGARLDAGNWINASSRDVKQRIHDLDRDAAFDALRSLQPVTFAYNANPADTHVGFIAEEVPDLVATPDRKGLSSMDVVAVLTKVIQEQQKTIDDMRARLDCLEERQ